MRVALLLNGLTRSFFDDPCMLPALRQDDITIDVFAHLPMNDPGISRFVDFWRTPRGGFRFRSLTIEKVIPLHDADLVHLADPSMATREWYDASPTQILLRLFRVLAVLRDAMKDAERADGERYDWIIRSRYDLKFIVPIEQVKTLMPAMHVAGHDSWGGYNDRLHFGPRDLMVTSLGIHDKIRPYVLSGGVPLHSETLFRHHLDISGSVARTRAVFSTVRHGQSWGPYFVEACGDIMRLKPLTVAAATFDGHSITLID